MPCESDIVALRTNRSSVDLELQNGVLVHINSAEGRLTVSFSHMGRNRLVASAMVDLKAKPELNLSLSNYVHLFYQESES